MFKYWIFLFTSNSLLALTTLHVTVSSDNKPGETGEAGDLRFCLNSMNEGLNSTPDDYAIVFDSSMTIQLNGILPIINNSAYPVNITIGNPGSTPTVTIDGNSGAYSGFFIPMGNVTIQNMTLQNLTARGGNGGAGISGGGGGMGAGGAIYAPQSFLNGSNPSITLMNVLTDNCSAIGGNGGSYVTVQIPPPLSGVSEKKKLPVKFLFSLHHCTGILLGMHSSTIVSIPVLTGEIFDTLPEPIRVYIRYLESRIQQLETRVHELETRLSKDSSNSSKPPSSDGLKRKPKSLRGRSSKKPGGQQGRVGKGLASVNNPDIIVTHTPASCTGCGSNLDNVQGFCAEQRQVFDIPQPKINVTEHRVEEKKCPCCGETTRALFPENIKGPVQYGDRIRALIAYFSHQHFIPVDRVCEIFKDIFGVALSPGTCANVDERLFANLEVFEAGLKAHLLAARVLHFDETGMRCEKKLHWVHVASSQMATFYTVHTKRGQEAMDAADILPRFQGIAVHDHWFPYFAYKQLKHGLCNAHHLRELIFVHEQEKEAWAKRMHDLLILANKEVEKHAELGVLSPEILLQTEQAYQQILTEGFAYHAFLPPLPTGKRGKQKQRDGKNLLDRLNEKRNCVLRFIHNFSVPFTNNQGERDIRMVKLKQKIGGCFRSFRGGEMFCRIRSYISTARKQRWNVWDALADAIRGSPRLLAIDQEAAPQAIAV